MNLHGHSWLVRWQLNLDPGYRRSGGRVSFLAGDLKSARLIIRPGRSQCDATRCIAPPCLCRAIDPVFMLMLASNLENGCRFTDCGSDIRQFKPLRDTLKVGMVLDDLTLERIRGTLASGHSAFLVQDFDLCDDTGAHCATLKKMLSILPATLH